MAILVNRRLDNDQPRQRPYAYARFAQATRRVHKHHIKRRVLLVSLKLACLHWNPQQVHSAPQRPRYNPEPVGCTAQLMVAPNLASYKPDSC